MTSWPARPRPRCCRCRRQGADGLGDLPARGVLGQEAVGTGLHRPGDRLFSPGEDGPHFTMREEYSGPLLPLIWRSMPDLSPSFRQFASGLKQRAEG